MKTVFVDTFYFLALLNPSDAAHSKSVAFTTSNPVRMVTTEWILTELADALARSRKGREEFAATLADLRSDDDVEIVPSSRELFEAGVLLYNDRPDKSWSLTDCFSFVVMQRQGLAEALTGDKHFEQAGFVALLRQ